jgi:hypothetical protein
VPYHSDSDVPDYVPKKKRAQWREVWNSAYNSAIKEGKSKSYAESSAFAQANGVTNKHKKAEGGDMKFERYIQFTKVNGINHTVEGILTDETPDKSGEICDYESSKPHYQEWSGEFNKATNGQSLGNVREMHQLKAVGKFNSIDYDDTGKAITGVALVVDPIAWEKCEKGVYTGFSHGGSYVGTPTKEGNYKRYTAKPSEISLVDNPCNPNAHFTFVRADGTEEMRKFVGSAEEAETTRTPPEEEDFSGCEAAIAAASPEEHDAAEAFHLSQASRVGNTGDPLAIKHMQAAVKHRDAAAALRVGGQDAGKYSLDARNASDALHWPSSVGSETDRAKLPDIICDSKGKHVDTQKVEETEDLEKAKKSKDENFTRGSAALNAQTPEEHDAAEQYHQDKADSAVASSRSDLHDAHMNAADAHNQASAAHKSGHKKASDFSDTARAATASVLKHKFGKAVEEDKMKEKPKKDKKPDGSDTDEKDRLKKEELGKLVEGLVSKAYEEAKLDKGMSAIKQLANILSELAWLKWSVYNEQRQENDQMSTLPDQIQAEVTNLANTLVAMAQEETSELVTSSGENKPPDDNGLPCGSCCSSPLYCIADSDILKASLTDEEVAAYVRDFIDVDGFHLVRASTDDLVLSK